MHRNRKYKTEANAFAALAEAFWEDAPGELGQSGQSSLERVGLYLDSPDDLISGAISLAFLADDELGLASNLLCAGRADESWAWLDRSAAHAYFRYQTLDHRVWRPSIYTRAIFNFPNFCSQFALALARGDEALIQWYAQQVYNVIQGGLADDCCHAVEYVDLYFDIAVSVLKNAWRSEEQVAERMPVYRDLFLSVGDEERVQQALLACARHHLQLAAYIAPRNDDEADHPFRLRWISHVAYELMAWVALYKRFYGPLALRVEHPMLMPALFDPQPQAPHTDSMLEKLHANAKVVFGESWLAEKVPHYDDLEESVLPGESPAP